VLAVVISVVSLFVSVVGLLYSIRSRRQGLLLSYFDNHSDPSRQSGRAIIHNWNRRMNSDGQQIVWEESSKDEQEGPLIEKANHALAALDLLGYLYSKRYIDRKDALEMWGYTTANVYRAAERIGYIEFRRKRDNGRTPWLWLHDFVVHAERKGYVKEDF